MDVTLEVSFDGLIYGVSVRRIWEHVQYRQVNPFVPVTEASISDVEQFVDVVFMAENLLFLSRRTLAEVRQECEQGTCRGQLVRLVERVDEGGIDELLKWLYFRLRMHARVKAVRNVPASFLPAAQFQGVGVQGLTPALMAWLVVRRAERATAKQWQQRIENLQRCGARDEEFQLSLASVFDEFFYEEKLSGQDLVDLLSLASLQLHVIPVVEISDKKLLFNSAKYLSVYSRRPKPNIRNAVGSIFYDIILGYWIYEILLGDLLESDSGWLVFAHDGHRLTTKANPSGMLESFAEASQMAHKHAQIEFPKVSVEGKWRNYTISGGEDYREWLVTLPFYAPSYFSEHFPLRNILLHIRCDIRRGQNGERVLLLQEVQSDWAQQARRIECPGYKSRELGYPPWAKEWPELAIKLMLLHAVHLRVDALVWPKGQWFSALWGRHAVEGLLKFYDKTLPKVTTRALKRFGAKVGTLGVSCFYSENVIDGADDRPLTRKEEDEGTHKVERFLQMYAVVLDEPLREAIEVRGFYAWGEGIEGVSFKLNSV